MNREELDYQGHNATICVPLKKADKDFVFLPKVKNEEVAIFRFSNYKLFEKYVYGDFMYEIAEKCNADFLGRYESDTFMLDVLPTAIEIVSKAIKLKKPEFRKHPLFCGVKTQSRIANPGLFLKGKRCRA